MSRLNTRLNKIAKSSRMSSKMMLEWKESRKNKEFICIHKNFDESDEKAMERFKIEHPEKYKELHKEEYYPDGTKFHSSLGFFAVAPDPNKYKEAQNEQTCQQNAED